MQYKNNSILVVPNSIKKDILLEISNLNTLLNIKVLSINELNKKYYFDYDEETIFYIMKKYNTRKEIAEIYLKNLYYIDNSEYEDNKLKFLKELKKDLIDNKKIILNNLFKNSLKDKTIIFLDIPKTKYNERLIKELSLITNVEVVDNSSSANNNPLVYEFNTLEEEVTYIATKICSLIKENVDINNIYITNLNDEYRLTIERIFSLFNIPITLNKNESIYNTSLVTTFLENYNSDINKSLDYIKGQIYTKEAEDIYNSLINIVNKYYFVEDYNEVKDMIVSDIKNINLSNNRLKNSVKEVDFLEFNFNEKDYVFLLNFTQGNIPKIYKDENYLQDKLMEKLNLDTAPFKNSLEKEMTINKLKSTNNLHISYMLSSLAGESYVSNLVEDMKLEIVKDNNIDLTYSNLYNKIKLASSKDLYSKYNTINSELPILNSNYTLEKYNNKFTGINIDSLYKYLNNKLNLSYTSLNNYYKCSFRYYIENILKLNVYEETFMQIVGDIFHEVLQNIFNTSKSFDDLYIEVVNKYEYNYSKKELFFLDKLKKELLFIIDTINNHNNFTNLDNELYEENVITNIEGNITIKFSGKIDKIKYKDYGDKTIIAIIDYKTGNPETNLNNVIYGLDMQLPVYLYLANNSNKLKNIEVAGFYLQKILNSEIIADNKHSYEQLKKDKLKLQGYSNEDYEIINEFDRSYIDSNVIKSLKVSKNGFYSYSKILNNKQIDKLVKITEEKIKEGANDILDAKFSINPKSIANKNVGCLFCKYKDICYMTEKDIVNLEEYKNLEFLGSDNNA